MVVENYAVSKTREYLDSIFVEQRIIDSVIPSQKFDLYGHSFSTPIMTPAFSHLKTFVPERKSGMYEYSKAASRVDAVNWVGMCENEEFKEIMNQIDLENEKGVKLNKGTHLTFTFK